jgi:ribosomal-protein-alanine N-acetyltransferase
VYLPDSAVSVQKALKRWRRPGRAAFFVWGKPPNLIGAKGGDLIGVINISEIVRGPLKSAYLGYFAFEPFAGRGLMTEGLRQVITYAFKKLKLHRLEANIQPGNHRSIRLVKRLGFRKEGFSPRYVKIGGRWRDHERWALLAEDW